LHFLKEKLIPSNIFPEILLNYLFNTTLKMNMDNIYLNHLLKRIALHDDQKAFSAFFDQYHSKLIKFAHLFVANYVHAEEIVSEVLIKLLKNRRNLHEIEKFEGYLFTMIKNQSLNFIKQNKKR